jgi:ABC-type sugar transport system ATPase subunit
VAAGTTVKTRIQLMHPDDPRGRENIPPMDYRETGPSRAPVLELNGIHKRYGGVHALRGAALRLGEAGVVHGLLGENGAGKSTMLGIMSGQIQPDAGEILMAGVPITLRDPADALRHGIAMVSQETAVAPRLTVAENILLGRRLVRRGATISWRRTIAKASSILDSLGLDYNPRALVGELRPDQRQMVEIARALSQESRVLILDEPTSLLSNDEVESLFASVQHLKHAGVSVVFVSHRLTEVFAIADELTVLRDGLTAASGRCADFDVHSLIDAMVGQDGAWANRQRTSTVRVGNREAPVVLSVDNLLAPGLGEPVSLEVREGEIVGLAGLVGAGRSELLEAIYGARPQSRGMTYIGDRTLNARSPRQAIDAGVGFLPPDRKGQGLVLSMSVRDNINMTVSLHKRRFRRPAFDLEERLSRQICDSMRVRTPSGAARAGTLSGGNQQKVALGKLLAHEPRLLLLDEPTRGVDVSAKADIHDLLRNAADRGTGLLISSSEYPELLELCDRLVVMFCGRVVASLPAASTTEPDLAAWAGGYNQ